MHTRMDNVKSIYQPQTKFGGEGGGRVIKISVFPLTGLKILGRAGTHIFFYYFCSAKKKNYAFGNVFRFAFPNA